MLGGNDICLRIPGITERRVRDTVVERVTRKLITRERVAELHVRVVIAPDECVRLCDAVSERVELLSERRYAGIFVHLAEPLFGAAEHLGGAHGLVIDGLRNVVAVEHMRIGGNEKICHEVDDIS